MGKSNISDVAKTAGVSKSTISNYLNGRYDNMSERTKRKIEKAIAKLNYVPNISARRLSAKEKSHAICVIIPVDINRAFESLYYTTVLGTIGRVSGELGYRILIYIRNSKEPEKEMSYLIGMANAIVDGFIIFDLDKTDFYFMEFARAHIPYVCIGKFFDLDDYNYVASDHAKTIWDCLAHLVGLGHSRIALLDEGDTSVVTTVRIHAFHDALRHYGLPSVSGYLDNIEGYNIHSEETLTRCRRLILQENPPTAMIVPNAALPSIERVLRENKLALGRDLSIIVLDFMEAYNLRFANYTRVASRASDVTEIALRKLLKYIDHRKEGFQSEILPLTLTPGSSTASPTLETDTKIIE